LTERIVLSGRIMAIPNALPPTRVVRLSRKQTADGMVGAPSIRKVSGLPRR
jgi:hypothetical protein